PRELHHAGQCGELFHRADSLPGLRRMEAPARGHRRDGARSARVPSPRVALTDRDAPDTTSEGVGTEPALGCDAAGKPIVVPAQAGIHPPVDARMHTHDAFHNNVMRAPGERESTCGFSE